MTERTAAREANTPLISVIVPCHNYGRFVPVCLESVLRQRLAGAAIELIVIDDASTDDSWGVLQQYRDVPRIRLFREERNQGYVRVYRRGMEAATGHYVLPLDADDFVVNERAFELQLALMDRSESVGFVHSDTRVVDDAGRTLRDGRAWSRTGIVPSAEAFRRLLLRNSVQHSGTLIRRDAYNAVGGYDPSLVNSIDWDLWLKLSRRYDVGYIAQPLYAYRLHDRNMHQRVTISPKNRAVVLAEVFMVLDRASAGAPKALRRRALAEAHLLTAAAHFYGFRQGPGWRSLATAAWLRPAIVARAGFWAAVARSGAGLVLGRRGYRALAGIARRIPH